MKKKKVWRYYCDFCKKAGCSGGHMKNHEAACTNNPDRVCGMCNIAGFDQQPIKDLIASVGNGNKSGIENLRELTEGCPACMLAAIRQAELQYFEEDENGFEIFSVEWNFADEKKAFWEMVNDQKASYSCACHELY